MAVRIRLARRGRKARAMYDIVVADARSPRDGRFIEKLGYYNPNTDPATINLNTDSAFDWVMNGAQPSETARAILSYKGVMMRKHLQVGVNKGAITQEEADKRFNKWLSDKEGKILAKVEGLQKAGAADAKARFEAETKVKEDRAAQLVKKHADLAAAEAAANAEASAEEEPEAAVEEAPATEAEVATPEVEETVAEEAAPAEEPAAVEEAAPEVEAKEEAPAAEAKEEAPAGEVKEDAPAKEEAPEESPAEDASEEEKK